MRLQNILTILTTAIIVASCAPNDPENRGSSTPIDSTNLNGTAPATWGADNPANDQDTNYANSSDTGTRRSNGKDNTVDPPYSR